MSTVFHDEIGISPKRYSRIARIRRMIAGVGTLGWAELAAACGFYDQPHLNAECRDLLHITPSELLAGEMAKAFTSCEPTRQPDADNT